MTYKDIQEKLELTGYSVAQSFWETGSVPALPFIVYTFPNNNDFIAENENYVEIAVLEVELYTKKKSIETEQAVEDVLAANFGPYRKTSSWIYTDAMQQTIYTMEVIITDVEQS